MNARHLEVFRAIMRHRSLSAAAESLNVSQPAVSKILRHFESRLGFNLFERVGGRLIATAEAHLLFEDADRVFREIEVLKQFAQHIRERKIGLLRIAASAPPSFSLVPAAIERFTRRNPDVRLILNMLPADEIADRIVIGEIDLGVTLAAISAPHALNQILAHTSIVAVMHRGSPLARLREITPDNLKGQRLISYGRKPRVGQDLDVAFQAEGHAREVSFEIALSISAMPLLQRKLGIALVDGLVPWADLGPFVALPFKPRVELDVVLVTSAGWAPSRYTKEFARDLRASLVDLPNRGSLVVSRLI